MNLRQTFIIAFFSALLFGTKSFSQNFDFISDYVRFDERAQVVTFEGQIEIKTEFGYFYPSFVQYNLNTEILYTDGQLNGVLSSGDRFVSTYAELDFRTQQAILRELKLKLATDLQVTAQLAQNDDFSSYAENIVVSSCVVCSLNPTPIWQIKAQQVLRDTQTQRVYIKNGFLDLFGIPVFYIPYASIPEPGVKRASGFLNPSLQATDSGEIGIKIPYYFNLSDTMDGRITAYLNRSDTQYLEGDFRKNGKGYRVRSEGAYSISEDDELANRYFFNSNLKISLPYEVNFEADYTVQSDYDFQSLNDYDREVSNLAYFERIKSNNFQYVGVERYLPPSESSNETISKEYPTILPRIQSGYSQSFQYGFSFDGAFDFMRVNNENASDITRLTSHINIAKAQVFDPGIVAKLNLGAHYRAYDEFSEFGSQLYQASSVITPYATLDLRMPFIKNSDKSRQTLTPRLFLGWQESLADGQLSTLNVTTIEQDYSDQFELNLNSALNSTNTGYRSALGLTYLMQTNSGHMFEAGLARTWIDEMTTNDLATSINSNEEWFGYANFSYANNWRLFSNFALSDEFNLTRSEINLQHRAEWASYTLKWAWLDKLEELGYPYTQSRLDLVGTYQFHTNMELGYDIGYDILTREPFDAQLALTYGNECIEINAAIDWAFEDGVVLEEPEFELSVDLLGLDDRPNNKWKRRQCSY